MARTPRTRWIEEGLRTLGAGGPEAVRVEKLAQSLGVTKGGFYGYFADRQALLDEMLDTWEELVVDQAIRLVDADGGNGRERLRGLFALAGGGDDLMPVELAIRDWARRDDAVAERVRRVDDRRMDYMREQFADFVDDEDEIEARCLLVFALFVGRHFVSAGHGKRSRAEVLRTATDYLLQD